MKRRAGILLFLACILSVAIPIHRVAPIQIRQAPEPWLLVECDEPYYYVKGATIQVYASSNVSAPATLSIYWNWRGFDNHTLVYWNTKTLNATWNIPTVNAHVGFYRFTVETLNRTVTLWRTLLNVQNWQPDTLPFAYTWKGVNYTLDGRTFTATRNGDTLNITYPKIPFQHTATMYRNNMSFLIRLSGATWTVDVLYFTVVQGVKWRLNGTLDNPQTFEFQCLHNPLIQWRRQLHRFQSASLVFDWDDLKRAGNAFTWNANTQTLSVTIPASFDIDPYIFECDFEGGNPEYTSEGWDSVTTAGDAELWYSSTWSYTGVNSSRSNSSNTGASRFAFARKDEIENRLNTRFYFYIEQIGASSANMQFYYLRAGSWRGFSVGLNTANNNISITWYNGSASQSKVLNNYWNLSTVYLVEIEFIRHATNASWTLYINEVIVNSEQGLHNDWQTDYVQVGHASNFRSGWTVTYYDRVAIDDAYIGAHEVGQDLTFTLTGSLNLFAAMTPNIALAFRFTDTLNLFSAGLANAALGFTFTDSLNLHASSTIRKELGFLLGGVIHFASSLTPLIETGVVDLTFILFETVHFWESMTPTFEGISVELAFILFDAVSFASSVVAPVVIRGLTSTTLMLMAFCVVLALAALAIAASKRD